METTNVSQRYLDDDKLISLGLKGDQEALHILFMRYRRLLYSLAYRLLRNHEEAEDAVQNCLLQGFRNLESVKSRGAFRSWLVRILINEALVIVRRKKSRTAIVSEQHSSEEQGACLAERFPAPGPDPEQKFARQESVAALMTHVVRLPTPLRSAILLCDIAEQTIRKASAMLGLAPNTVKARLHRGRTKLGLAMRQSTARVNISDERTRHNWGTTRGDSPVANRRQNKGLWFSAAQSSRSRNSGHMSGSEQTNRKEAAR